MGKLEPHCSESLGDRSFALTQTTAVIPDLQIPAWLAAFRIRDRNQTWRVVYHMAATELVVLHVFSKKTGPTPKSVIDLCRERLKAYREATK